MSLMEPEKKNDLYINPIFDDEQRWIWTADAFKGAAGEQWVVGFNFGLCDGYSLSNHYVRAVRFGQSSP